MSCNRLLAEKYQCLHLCTVSAQSCSTAVLGGAASPPLAPARCTLWVAWRAWCKSTLEASPVSLWKELHVSRHVDAWFQPPSLLQQCKHANQCACHPHFSISSRWNSAADSCNLPVQDWECELLSFSIHPPTDFLLQIQAGGTMFKRTKQKWLVRPQANLHFCSRKLHGTVQTTFLN